MPTKKQRQNLAKLAIYLEGLPPSYGHFDMRHYAHHRGDCDLGISPMFYAAKKPDEFLHNCGTVACAAGHGPAAGMPFRRDEFYDGEIACWGDYTSRAFGGDERPNGGWVSLFDFFFESDWRDYDNHHYGAAARIRYFLDTGKLHYPGSSIPSLYAPYRKGSRSKARRQSVEAFSA